MNLDEQVAMLQMQWRDEDEARNQLMAENKRKKLEKRRADMLAGHWKPDCCCSACVKAVLLLAPDQVCSEGRKCAWW